MTCPPIKLGVVDPCREAEFRTGLLAVLPGVHEVVMMEAHSLARIVRQVDVIPGEELAIPLAGVNERTHLTFHIIDPNGDTYEAFFADTLAADPDAVLFAFETKQVKV